MSRSFLESLCRRNVLLVQFAQPKLIFVGIAIRGSDYQIRFGSQKPHAVESVNEDMPRRVLLTPIGPIDFPSLILYGDAHEADTIFG
jgi:hypothetical protein